MYGEWPEFLAQPKKEHNITIKIAFDAEITNGSVIDRLDVSYIAQGTDGEAVNEDECNGVVEFEMNGYEFCREIITLENPQLLNLRGI